jgi:hypothetical protein
MKLLFVTFVAAIAATLGLPMPNSVKAEILEYYWAFANSRLDWENAGEMY